MSHSTSDSTAESATESTAPTVSLSTGTVVGFLVFVELTSGFIQGYLLPTLPTIAAAMNINAADITWFNTVQILAAGICVPILAKLGDMYGHRKVLRGAIASVAIGMLVVALASLMPGSTGFTVMLVGRLLMGPLAVWLPLEIALVHSRVTGEPARKGVGWLVSSLTGGVVLGSLVFGQVQKFTTSLTVLMMVPVVILAMCLVIVFTLIPESTTRKPGTIDWTGFALLATFMGCLLMGLREVQSKVALSTMAIVLIAVAVVLLIVFVMWELRQKAPAIDMRMIASPSLWPVYVTAFVFGMVVFGTQAPIATFLAVDPRAIEAMDTDLIYGFGFSQEQVSNAVAGIGLLNAIGAATFAYLAKPLGLKNVIYLGIILNIVGNGLMGFGITSLPIFFGGFVCSFLGCGFLLGSLSAMIAEVAPRGDTGIATGVFNSLRTMGGAVAGAVFGVVLSALLIPGTQEVSAQGYRTVWLICAAMFIPAFFALLFLKPAPKRDEVDG